MTFRSPWRPTAPSPARALRPTAPARCRAVLLAGLLLGCIVGTGPAAAWNQAPRFQHLQIEDGLSQTTVRCIAQDPLGFIWLGTQEGLNRFDGHEFRIFVPDPEDPGSISHSDIYTLHVDSRGRLWIGAADGLNLYDPDSESFTAFRPNAAQGDGGTDIALVSIAEDPMGVLWLGYLGQGLFSFDPDTRVFQAYHHDDSDPGSLASDYVNAVFVDLAGTLWVGSNAGLDRFERNSQVFVHHRHDSADPRSLSHDAVLTIGQDPAGHLWVGTDGGLSRLEPDGSSFTSHVHDPADKRSIAAGAVRALAFGEDGRFWVGMQNLGLSDLEVATGRFTHYRHDRGDAESLADDQIWDLHFDRAGVLWAGTDGRGVDRYDQFSTLFTPQHSTAEAAASANDYVRCFLVDSHGDLWVGTEGLGVARKNEETGLDVAYRPVPGQTGSLGSGEIYSICEDHFGTVWLGAVGGTIYEFDRETGTFRAHRMPLPPPTSLRPQTVRVLRRGQDGRLWVGTDGSGVFRFDPGTGLAERYEFAGEHAAQLTDARIFSLLEDSKGRIWFGLFGRGLLMHDPHSGDSVLHRHDPGDRRSLSNDQVMPLHEGARGGIWIGTNGGGLDRLDPATGRFVNFAEGAGLANNAIYSIQEDRAGRLWLSHNRGLSCFDPHLGTCKNFNKADGLQSNEFNGGAGYTSAAGELFFGGIDGYNRFKPEDIRSNDTLPPVVITGMQLFNRPVGIGSDAQGRTVLESAITTTESLRLTHKDKVLSFEYAALLYGATGKTRYAYRLEGFDDDWNEVGDRRFATYTQIPPGRYTFRVKATNANGDWTEDGAELKITVVPPVWQTAWFRGATVLAVFVLIWAVYRYRTRVMRLRERELEHNVHERTLELRKEISERVAVEYELAKAHREAVKATEAKSTFLATMSHEIRTPMNGVIGMAQLLLESASLNAEDREQVETIQTSGESLLTIINDILDFSKIEAGKMEIEEIPFDLQTACLEVTELLAPRASGKGLELLFRYAPDAPRHLVGDVGRIRQVALNLVGNAIKFTSEGHVILQVEKATHGDADRCLKVSIRDTGIGLGDEERRRLFRPFSQADSSTTRRFGGTGLGLVICKQLAELMGGRIGVDSTPGEGSTFWFTLDLETADVPVETPASSPRAGARILIVDPVPASAGITAELVTGMGCEPVIVGTEDKALPLMQEEASAGRPLSAAIFSGSPRTRDGHALAAQLQVAVDLPPTPLLLMSPACLPQNEAELQAAGFAGMLVKPARPSALKTALALLCPADTGAEAAPFIDRRLLARTRAARKGSDAPAPEVKIGTTRALRVLVAEDNTVNQRVAKRMLEKAGCRVDLAANGEEAVDMWLKLPYDVVFMDCRMPEMDGYTATGEIRARESSDRHTPIIAMTANVMEGDRERCLEAGMDDYLPKPLKMDSCHAALARWTGDAAESPAAETTGDPETVGA